MKLQFLITVWFSVYAVSSHAVTKSFTLPNAVGKQFVEIASQRDVRAFAELLKTLPQPNVSKAVVDEKGNTLLHLLAQHGRADMIALAFLLNGGVLDADTLNNAGSSAQQLADVCGHDEVCSLLRSVQAVPRPPLLERVFYFLGRSVQPHNTKWREGYDRIRGSMAHAAGHGEYEAVVALVDAMRLMEEMGRTDIDGISISSDTIYSYALEKAIHAHDTEMFNFLVANGAVKKWHLHEAAIANNVHAINSLLAAGIDVDALGASIPHEESTALQVAALNGNIDAVVTLLDAGADINYRSGYYNYRYGYYRYENLSALDLALHGNEFELKVYLVTKRTTLQHLRIANILIKRGATITNNNVSKLALFVDSLTANVNYDRNQIMASIDTIIAAPPPIALQQHSYRRRQYAAQAFP